MIKEKFYGENIDELFSFFKVNVNGILHIGAHKCEELETYLKYTTVDKILWIEAIESLIKQNLEINSSLKIINAVVSNEDGKDIEFKIANLTNCSSILDLKYHKEIHPEVEMIKTISIQTTTIQTLYKQNNISPSEYNTLVMDIQGAELLALEGMGDVLNNIDNIYVEVNEKELYEGCCNLDTLNNFLINLDFERKYLTILNGYGNAFYIKNKK
jgi:FkbM family methyltransferase